MCSDLLISLLACSPRRLKLVAVLVLVVSTPEAVDQCCSWLVFLTCSLSAFALERIDSLAPESTRSFCSRVLDCLSFLTSGMTSLTKINGLKCKCFSFLLDLVNLSFLLVGFFRVFNSWASVIALSKLLELSFCSLSFYLLLGFTLPMINTYLQPQSQLFPLLPMKLLLISES